MDTHIDVKRLNLCVLFNQSSLFLKTNRSLFKLLICHIVRNICLCDPVLVISVHVLLRIRWLVRRKISMLIRCFNHIQTRSNSRQACPYMEKSKETHVRSQPYHFDGKGGGMDDKVIPKILISSRPTKYKEQHIPISPNATPTTNI